MVEKEDVNEAMRLMEMSKQSLYEEEQGGRSDIHVHVVHRTTPFLWCIP